MRYTFRGAGSHGLADSLGEQAVTEQDAHAIRALLDDVFPPAPAPAQPSKNIEMGGAS